MRLFVSFFSWGSAITPYLIIGRRDISLEITILSSYHLFDLVPERKEMSGHADANGAQFRIGRIGDCYTVKRL